MGYMPKEASLKNLILYKKGHNTPGTGRPKGSKSLTTILKDMIEKDLTLTNKETGVKETKSTQEWIIASMVRDSVKGNFKATREIFDRIEGKAVQKVNTVTTLDLTNMNLSSLTTEQIERLIADNTTTVDAQLEEDE